MNLATEARNAHIHIHPSRGKDAPDHSHAPSHRRDREPAGDSERRHGCERSQARAPHHHNGRAEAAQLTAAPQFPCDDLAGELASAGIERSRRAGSKSSRGRRASRDHAQTIVAHLRQRIGEQRYEMWFEQARLEVRDGTLEVRADNPFVAQRIDSNFAVMLRTLARETLGEDANVVIGVEQAAANEGDTGATRDAHASSSSPHVLRHNGNGAATGRSLAARSAPRALRLHALEDFVTGPTNQLAHTMCLRLADQVEAPVSLLFIHGECGVGKTHLLQGVCRRYIERTGRALQVRYVTAEQFTNEYIAAIKSGTTETFRKRLRRLDLLAIDDVHFLADKGKTQSEFQHTIDAIAHSGARVVLASDHHPQHIQRFSQSLVSRFMSGMVVKIERPDRALRTKLIHRMAERRGLHLSEAAIEELAGRCTGSVRELEGAITRIAAYRELLGGSMNGSDGAAPTLANGSASAPDQEVGLLLVEQVLREERARPARIVHIATIIDVVCSRLGLAKADLMGAGRHRKIVLGRSLIVYLARELTAHSYPEIAHALGRVNHSTVHTADQRLRRHLDADAPLEPGIAEPARTLRELADMLRREACRTGNDA